MTVEEAYAKAKAIHREGNLSASFSINTGEDGKVLPFYTVHANDEVGFSCESMELAFDDLFRRLK